MTKNGFQSEIISNIRHNDGIVPSKIEKQPVFIWEVGTGKTRGQGQSAACAKSVFPLHPHKQQDETNEQSLELNKTVIREPWVAPPGLNQVERVATGAGETHKERLNQQF